MSPLVCVDLDGLEHLAQQPAGALVAVWTHDPVEAATTRYVRALYPHADHVGLERRFLPLVAGEVVYQRRDRVVEQRQLYRHLSFRPSFYGRQNAAGFSSLPSSPAA